jgi:hypothetical protein
MSNNNIEIASLSVVDLLALYSKIVEDLRERHVTRTSNNPVADFAEYLCEKALNLTRADKNAKGFDATDENGLRYQIKARRLTRHSKVRQLGVMRELTTDNDSKPFDYLAGVLFNEDFSLLKACLLPIEQVIADSEYIHRTNSYRFFLRDSVWQLPNAIDITSKLSNEISTLSKN